MKMCWIWDNSVNKIPNQRKPSYVCGLLCALAPMTCMLSMDDWQMEQKDKSKYGWMYILKISKCTNYEDVNEISW